jgi:hypothetical protein
MVAQAITMEHHMSIRNANAIETDGLSTAQVPATVNQRGPILLAEAELDQVAAAGSKLGGGTEGRDLLGNPPARSA